MIADAILYAACGVLFLIGSSIQFAAFSQRSVWTRREYCVQFRLKRSREDWTVINWSVGTHKRAREALKYMLNDRTYLQYEYRVATRKLTEWEVK